MIKARSYQQRIALINTTRVADGFGGFTNTDSVGVSLWCDIVDMNGSSRTIDFGITDFTDTFLFKFRFNPSVDIDAHDTKISYNNQKYDILSVRSIGLKDIEVNVLARKESFTDE